jgi:hypothetical protein
VGARSWLGRGLARGVVVRNARVRAPSVGRSGSGSSSSTAAARPARAGQRGCRRSAVAARARFGGAQDRCEAGRGSGERLSRGAERWRVGVLGAVRRREERGSWRLGEEEAGAAAASAGRGGRRLWVGPARE